MLKSRRKEISALYIYIKSSAILFKYSISLLTLCRWGPVPRSKIFLKLHLLVCIAGGRGFVRSGVSDCLIWGSWGWEAAQGE